MALMLSATYIYISHMVTPHSWLGRTVPHLHTHRVSTQLVGEAAAMADLRKEILHDGIPQL